MPMPALAAAYPEIAREFHPSRNGDLTAADVPPWMNEAVWWLCAETGRHEWASSPRSRVRTGSGCPVCRRLRRTGALSSHAVAAEFDADANPGVVLDDLTIADGREMTWRCAACRRTFTASPYRRVTNGQSCPYCSGRRVCEENSLATTRPALAAEWDHERNGGVRPEDITASDSRPRHWICGRCGHRYVATASWRRRGRGCPVEGGKVLTAARSLAARFPEIAKLLPLDLNDGVGPDHVSWGSGRVMNWRCPLGHTWRSTVNRMTSRGGHGCVECSQWGRSEREIRLACELAVATGLDLNAHRVTPARKGDHEVDILWESAKVVVQYDGVFYHGSAAAQARDRRRTASLEDRGYTVIRVRERGLPLIGPHDISVVPGTPTRQITDLVLDRIDALGLATERTRAYRGTEGEQARELADAIAAMRKDEARDDKIEVLVRRALPLLEGRREISDTVLRREIKAGFSDAKRVRDRLAERGFLGPDRAPRPRYVLRTATPAELAATTREEAEALAREACANSRERDPGSVEDGVRRALALLPGRDVLKQGATQRELNLTLLQVQAVMAVLERRGFLGPDRVRWGRRVLRLPTQAELAATTAEEAEQLAEQAAVIPRLPDPGSLEDGVRRAITYILGRTEVNQAELAHVVTPQRLVPAVVAELEARGLVSPPRGFYPRKVLRQPTPEELAA